MQIEVLRADNEDMFRKIALGFNVLFLLAIAGFVEFVLLIDGLPHLDGIAVKLGFGSIETLIVGVVLVLIIRFVSKVDVPVILFWFLTWIAIPVLMLIALALTSIELLSYPNFVFSHFYIRFDRVTMLAIGTSLITLSLIPRKTWIKHWERFLFIIPVVFLLAMGLIWTWPNDVFLELVKEDHLIENTQVIVLLVGSVIAFLTGKFFWKRGQGWLAILFFLVCGALFFISGDEIDWGQRLIGFATPDQMAQENLQGEVTVHNINGIHQLIGYGYTVIAFYGAFAWIVVETFFRKQKKHWSPFVPESYLFFFFYLSFIYDFYQLIGGAGFGEWSEPAELLLYSGMSLFLVIHYLKLKEVVD